MATEKLTLDLSLVLPEIPDARDACVARLTEILEAQQIESAHLVRENGARLCLHYDPAKLSIDRVRELVRVAGAQINDRYRHETLRVDGMDCETCATVIEHSLSRADGILEAAAIGVPDERSGEMVKINDKGEDACSHFFPDGKRLIWTSTRDLTDLPKHLSYEEFKEKGYFVVYMEDAGEMVFDLSKEQQPLDVIAIDTKKAYEEINVGTWKPRWKNIEWVPPRESDWVVVLTRTVEVAE